MKRRKPAQYIAIIEVSYSQKKYDFLPNAASVSSSLEMMLDKRCWRGATAVLFSNAIKRYQLKINR